MRVERLCIEVALGLPPLGRCHRDDPTLPASLAATKAPFPQKSPVLISNVNTHAQHSYCYTCQFPVSPWQPCHSLQVL